MAISWRTHCISIYITPWHPAITTNRDNPSQSRHLQSWLYQTPTDVLDSIVNNNTKSKAVRRRWRNSSKAPDRKTSEEDLSLGWCVLNLLQAIGRRILAA